ncbi:uncharacterized protein LOC123915498 [Trifolium pratense]|uniref:uncharacterized protein LOC123915498 n=1 Tax=Trifolium pratense TaxID=57577 RepID=UPI001E6916D5|nr:uncharacterized protein LOC123915498 [Trifolium pratense]XP_045822604.1 uncharacterized protein LOC123915498 [Trifolium pratense]
MELYLYQSLGKYQKPKGSNIKQVLKVMIILAVCVWLLYQIKNIKTKNYGGQTKIVVGCGAKLFGRKGILSRLDEGAFPNSRMVDSVGEVTNEYKSHDREEVQRRDLPNDMQVRKNAKSEFSLKENAEDEDTKRRINEKGKNMQKNVVESATKDGVIIEEMDEVESFHDENGVPPDSNDENISTFSNVNWLKKINIYEVAYGVENDAEMNLEGSINVTTADKEINAGITTHVDASGLQSSNRWR